MKALKSKPFSAKDRRTARLAKALGHPARVAIIRILLQRQTCICGDIVGLIPLSQSTVSQHLRELRTAGLIRGRTEGTSVCYCLDPGNWKAAEKIFRDLFEIVPEQNICC